jgi:ATP-dependent RNA helicase DOB1
MLYKAAPLIRELAWVIYDEIHYMQDVERGVVWEESIVLLPHDVRFVFLSATIPNAQDFSEWIADIHRQSCHVILTETRPVPLEFFMSAPGKGLLLIRKEDGELDEGMLALAFADAEPPSESKRLFRGIVIHSTDRTPVKGSRGSGSRQIQLTISTISDLFDRDLGPVIVFCFRRKECQELANRFGSRSFASPEDAEHISEILDLTIEKLSEADKKLPQIEETRQLMKRGIGVHHGGLIPMMKELIEILFQEKWIKVLIATETFAMGLNMPARTVLFHCLTKYDGTRERVLHGGEFIQMSGRAGRRGFDPFGCVVLCTSPEVSRDEVAEMLNSKADPLLSQFHLTYHMILSLLSSPHMTSESLMRLSFHQFQLKKKLPEKRAELDARKAALDAFEIPNEAHAKLKAELLDQIEATKVAIRELVARPANLPARLTLGSVIRTSNGLGWGIVIALPQNNAKYFIVAFRATKDDSGALTPVKLSANGAAYLVRVGLKDITQVSTLSFEGARDLLNAQVMPANIEKLTRAEAAGLEIVAESAFIKEGADEYAVMTARLSDLNSMLSRCPNVPDEVIARYREKERLAQEYQALETEFYRLKSEVMLQNLLAMFRVLERLVFITADRIVVEKGRAAAVITAGNELVLTEILYDGVFKDLTPQQIAALISAFASDDECSTEPQIPPDLATSWAEMQKIETRLSETEKECGIDKSGASKDRKMDPTYICVTYNWAAGANLATLIEENPDLFEGTIIRTLRRTEEVLRQAARAAKEMGECALEVAILSAITLIKRDIVFVASLYI